MDLSSPVKWFMFAIAIADLLAYFCVRVCVLMYVCFRVALFPSIILFS